MEKLKVGSYLQKIMERIPFDGKIFSISINAEGDLYACTDKGLCRYKCGVWQELGDGEIYSKVLCQKNGRVVAAKGNNVYVIGEKGSELLGEFPYEVTDFSGDDKLYVLTLETIHLERDNDFYRLQNLERTGCRFSVYNNGEKVCVSDDNSIQRMEGKRRTWRCIFPEHSTMPRINIRCTAFDKNGYLLVGAEEGFFIYDYKSGWYSHKEIPALPEESVYSICVCDDGAFLIGTDAGAVLIKNGAKKYLPATRYAFSTDVEIVASYGKALYTVSDGGIIKITEQEMTLEEKAYHLFEETEKYFPRKQGYITWVKSLGDVERSEISDNDGLWTHMYLAGLAMCYAKTKDEKVLEAARKAKDAMLFLTRATELKGFTARAVRFPDEAEWGVGLDSGEIGSEWHRSSDGTYEWLGETSSDEMTGHYAGFSLYYDLCADDEEKAEICEAVCNITDHILENDGYLIDCDGKPTSWACWNEHALNSDSMWMWEKGVNSLEMLNFLMVSYHMSGDEKYLNKYKSLISDHHFLINAAYHKRADGHTCHIDDNLAMLNTLSLLRLEKDPAVRQYLLLGLAAHYDYEKIEGNPYYNFIYKAFTEAPCDVDFCVKCLKEYPYDIQNYAMLNGKRRNIEYDAEAEYWGGSKQIKVPFAWDERPFTGYGINPFGVDNREEKVCTESGSSFIFLYWLGRFFDIIE